MIPSRRTLVITAHTHRGRWVAVTPAYLSACSRDIHVLSPTAPAASMVLMMQHVGSLRIRRTGSCARRPTTSACLAWPSKEPALARQRDCVAPARYRDRAQAGAAEAVRGRLCSDLLVEIGNRQQAAVKDFGEPDDQSLHDAMHGCCLPSTVGVGCAAADAATRLRLRAVPYGGAESDNGRHAHEPDRRAGDHGVLCQVGARRACGPYQLGSRSQSFLSSTLTPIQGGGDPYPDIPARCNLRPGKHARPGRRDVREKPPTPGRAHEWRQSKGWFPKGNQGRARPGPVDQPRRSRIRGPVNVDQRHIRPWSAWHLSGAAHLEAAPTTAAVASSRSQGGIDAGRAVINY